MVFIYIYLYKMLSCIDYESITIMYFNQTKYIIRFLRIYFLRVEDFGYFEYLDFDHVSNA